MPAAGIPGICTSGGRAAGGDKEVTWPDLGLPTTGEKGSLAKRVRDFLKDQDMLVDRLKPARVLEMALAEGENEKRLGDVYDTFLKHPHLPLLESMDVLYQATTQGVHEGSMGARLGDRMAFKEPLSGQTLNPDVVLVRPEAVERQPEALPPEPPPVPRPGGETKPSQPGAKRLTLRVRVPWDKMSDVVRGVLLPLHGDGASLAVELSIKAESAQGIRDNTLQQKVMETLHQIGAEVLEEKKE